jgi:hypothetical protein
MRKKIIALSVSIVLAISFLAPAFMNAQAQVSSESRVLNTILALTEDIKRKAQLVNNNLDNIDDDLLLKQKFWQIVLDDPFEANLFGLFNEGCDFNDDSACAFNVESIQFRFSDLQGEVNAANGPCVQRIIVDDVETDLSGKGICVPTNLTVDMGVGKIGAADRVEVLLDGPFSGIVEWNGEKPQGLSLQPTLCC